MTRTSALAMQTRNQAAANYGVLGPGVQPRRILLIEDNASDVFLIQRMLCDVSGDHNFIFTDVPRLVDALELLDSTAFDLILLDLNLLDIEGTATIAALHAEAPRIPIIVHSGSNDPKLKAEALMCGARHFLIKGRESPFSLKFMIQETLVYAQA